MNSDSVNLLVLAELHSTAIDRSQATISNHACGHARLFIRLKAGKGVTLNTVDRVFQWFSDNWLPDQPWPAAIPRPAPSPGSPVVWVDGADNPLSLNKRGQVPARALARELMRAELPPSLDLDLPGVREGLHANEAAWITSIKQAVYKYGDNGSHAGRLPREHTRAHAIVQALIQAGDARFTAYQTFLSQGRERVESAASALKVPQAHGKGRGRMKG